MKKPNQEEFLLLKIKTPAGISFYDEHIALIKKHGYVDFAKVGNSILKSDIFEEGNTIFIKESISSGGNLYRAVTSGILDDGIIYPSYYDSFEGLNRIWVRLVSLELIKDEKFLDRYKTRAGGDVRKALKSMSPNFFIREI